MAKKIFGNEIGIWTELKLKCIKKYLGAYSNILNCAGFKKYYFIDAFAGSGWCKTRKTRKPIYGSPLIALNIDPPFTKYFFIELDAKKVKVLEKIKADYPEFNITIQKGDCNVKIDSALNQIERSTPFVALLDPQAGDLYFKTISKIAKKEKSEVLINFPFGMAVRRYMPLTTGKRINKDMRKRLTKIFGNDNWQLIYSERKKNTLSARAAREKYLDLYLHNLLKSGFKFYAIKDIKNTLGNHIYYLIFATHHIKGLEKIKDVIVEDELERNTLFFMQELISKIYRTFKGEKNLNLITILKKLLSGKHLYKKQDFKNALIKLEKGGKLIRAESRKRARSFRDDEIFKII